MKKVILISVLSAFATLAVNAKSSEVNETYIDNKGVVRWSQTGDELSALGVNYGVPFSYWKQREPIGVDQYRAIDEDVYHLSRLGLDGYRIHVWDCYISDEYGNLVDNEYLKMYDYMHYKLKQRGIKLYITPINLFTDNGGGFASLYGGSLASYSNPETYPIMAHYLQEFVNHVNPYTGIAYKDDPDIVAFELVNEPSHWKKPEVITDFINLLYDAIRETGCNKPLLYNMTTTSDYIDSVFASKIDGGSFQWYPTGLTANFNLRGNYLPYVDQYKIPFADEIKRRKMPKFIYEFSPADVLESAAMYPAMARSFREAGFQFAAKFTYDPLHSAYSNIEFKTHFMNMIYTPHKAMGMMIASEVFKDTPMYESYGRYPENNSFGNCTLDPIKQSAEYISNTKYLYTHETSAAPKDVATLEKIAGVGNSPIVQYSGNSIYILDKIEDGIWRLEVMPDAFIVDDPFFVPTLEKEVAVAINREQKMSLSLPNLGEDFKIMGLNSGNNTTKLVLGSDFTITPGAYLLTKDGLTTSLGANSEWQNITLGEYYTTSRVPKRTYVLNHSGEESIVGDIKKIKVDVVSVNKPKQVNLKLLYPKKGFTTIEMISIDEYRYEVQLPDDVVASETILNYYIEVVDIDGKYSTYPSNSGDIAVNPTRTYADDLELIKDSYQISIVEESQPIYLYDVNIDYNKTIRLHRRDKLIFTPSDRTHGRVLNLYPRSVFKECTNVASLYCFDRLKDRSSDIDDAKYIEVYGKVTEDAKLNVKLIMRDGSAYEVIVEIGCKNDQYRVAISDLQPAQYTMHPLPFPYFDFPTTNLNSMSNFDVREVEKVQFGVMNSNSDIAIEWIRLTK